MFKKLLVAAALALAPVSGVAHAELSTAPVQQTEGDAAFIAWLQVLNQHMERAGAAAQPFLQLDMNFDPNDEAAAMALLRQISQMATTARSELTAVRGQLAAMPEFSHPNARPEMVNVAHIVLRDARSSSAGLEQMVSDMIALVGAIERRDGDEVDRLLPRLENGSIILIRSQAGMLRARQQLVRSTDSTYWVLAAMAHLYDGLAVIMPSDATFDRTALDPVVSGLSQTLVGHRAAVAAERATLSERDPDYRTHVEIVAVRQRMLEANERLHRVLSAAAQEARAGQSTEITRAEHMRLLGELEYEFQGLSRQQIDLFAQLTH